jgi:phosphatidylserine/phosphatidylglycerophosphate/cardiolipin synthase-like enzyme
MPGDGTTYSAPGLQAFFQSRRAGLEAQLTERLVAFIEGTKESLDCAIYDLRHPGVLEALARVAESGKRVRIVYDGSKERSGGIEADPKPSGTEEALDAAGLLRYAEAVHDSGRHLMHDKFLIRDGQSVWSGSANFTVGGLELQDNNCLILDSPELAATYARTFAELQAKGERRALTLTGTVKVGEAACCAYFTPKEGEGIEQTVAAALHDAHRVRVLAFLISDPGILSALAAFKDAPDRDIRGIYDPHGMQDVLRYSKQDQSAFWFLHDARFVAAPTHAYTPGREQDFMHDKVFIIDDRLVITGSYNFSENAEANDENVLAIESPALAAAYTAYFDALYAAYTAHRDAPQEAALLVSAADPMGAALSATRGGNPMTEQEIRAHVLRLCTRAGLEPSELTFTRARGTFRGEAEAGRTAHFIVYSDGSAAGNASAQAVLASAETDYATVRDWFGGVNLPAGHDGDDQKTPRTAQPLQVLMDPQAGGAYHFGCDATDLYVEPAPQLAEGFMVAELVEVFEAAINNGWDCGHANGEALSRALAADRSPQLVADLLQTEQDWWANGHADYISTNTATDQDELSNGCGTLFLNYVHSQLGFSWKQIATTGGRALADTYQRLTGRTGAEGFSDFVARLATLDQGGRLNLPASGNPFPLGGGGAPAARLPVGATAAATSGGGGGRAALTWGALIVIVLVVIGVLIATGMINLGSM